MAGNSSQEDEWYAKHVEKLKNKRKEKAESEEKKLPSKKIESTEEKRENEPLKSNKAKVVMPYHPRSSGCGFKPRAPFGFPRNSGFPMLPNQNRFRPYVIPGMRNVRPPALIEWTPPILPLMGVPNRPCFPGFQRPRSFRPRFSKERVALPSQDPSLQQNQPVRMELVQDKVSKEMGTNGTEKHNEGFSRETLPRKTKESAEDTTGKKELPCEAPKREIIKTSQNTEDVVTKKEPSDQISEKAVKIKDEKEVRVNEESNIKLKSTANQDLSQLNPHPKLIKAEPSLDYHFTVEKKKEKQERHDNKQNSDAVSLIEKQPSSSPASDIMSAALSLEERSYLAHLKTLKVGKKMTACIKAEKNVSAESMESKQELNVTSIANPVTKGSESKTTMENLPHSSRELQEPLPRSVKKAVSKKIKMEIASESKNLVPDSGGVCSENSSQTSGRGIKIKEEFQDNLGNQETKNESEDKPEESIKLMSEVGDFNVDSCLHSNGILYNNSQSMKDNSSNLKDNSCVKVNYKTENQVISESSSENFDQGPNVLKTSEKNVEKGLTAQCKNEDSRQKMEEKKKTNEFFQNDSEKAGIKVKTGMTKPDISNQVKNNQSCVSLRTSQPAEQRIQPLEEPVEAPNMSLRACSVVSSGKDESCSDKQGKTQGTTIYQKNPDPENTVLKVKPSLKIQAQKRTDPLTEFSSSQPVSFTVSQVISSAPKFENLGSEPGQIGLPVLEQPHDNIDSNNLTDIPASEQIFRKTIVDNRLSGATASMQNSKRARVMPVYRAIKVRTSERKTNVKRVQTSSNLISVKIIKNENTKDVNLNSIATQQDELLSEISDSSNELCGSVDAFSDKMTVTQDEIELDASIKSDLRLSDFVILDSTFDIADEESSTSLSRKRPTASDFFESRFKHMKEEGASNKEEKKRMNRRSVSSERKVTRESTEWRTTEESDYGKEGKEILQPMKIAPSTYERTLQEDYDPKEDENVDGLEYIQPISGYHCSLCQVFFFDNPTAMHHCTLLSHKMKVVSDEAERKLDYEEEIDKELDFIEAKKLMRKRRFEQ